LGECLLSLHQSSIALTLFVAMSAGNPLLSESMHQSLLL
jgi:hypothetical protein